MTFVGFSLPEGAWLPPELLDILPDIGTMSELKVLLVALAETMRVGVVEAVISLTDFEAMTGLDRKSVSAGISQAVERGTIVRQQIGNSYLYRLHFTGGPQQEASNSSPAGRGNFPLVGRGKTGQVGGEIGQVGGEIGQVGVEIPPHVVLHVHSPQQEDIQQDNTRAAIVAEMRQLGVSLKVAQKMAGKYDVEYLLEKLKEARFAVEQGLADNGPGWFVASVREEWQAPLGYGEKKKAEESKDRRRYVEGKYKDLIQH